MSEPVGRWVGGRVVERDRRWVQPLDHLEQMRSETLVVADHVAIRTEVAEVRCVEAADDGDPLAGRGDEERALPRAVCAGDEVEARVRREQRLADEGQPEVDVVLAKDARSLVELLVHECLLGRQGEETSRGYDVRVATWPSG